MTSINTNGTAMAAIISSAVNMYEPLTSKETPPNSSFMGSNSMRIVKKRPAIAGNRHANGTR